MPRETVLVVDDERLVRWSLQQKLQQWGYNVSTAEDGATALGRAQIDNPDLITLDVKLPDMTGIDLLSELRNRNVNVPVIMITAFGVVDDAVRALKLGAYDFIEKPINFEKLENAVRNALEARRLRSEVARTHEIQRSEFSVDRIIGVSRHIKEIRELVKKVAASEASTILILGESGTGKDLVAHAIHFESNRRDRPFFAINCAAIPETLMESELFGHEKGAFTDAHTRKLGQFELAHEGSLFLDEIGEMGPSTQAKLLRVLEHGEFLRVGGTKPINVDVRIIAATNRDLALGLKEGTFRPDLYYRLNVVTVHLPPLRERRDDLLLLIRHFAQQKAHDMGIAEKTFKPEAVDILMRYHWPGNVRELENLMERLLVLSEGPTIGPEELPDQVRRSEQDPGTIREQVLQGRRSLGDAVDEFEREIIGEALAQTDFNQTRAAELLGTTRRILKYRMDKLGIQPAER